MGTVLVSSKNVDDQLFVVRIFCLLQHRCRHNQTKQRNMALAKL